MSKKNVKYGFIGIVIFMMMIIPISSKGKFDIVDVEYLWSYLEKDTPFTIILRALGNWLYSFLSMVNDYCYDAFMQLAKFDIMKIEFITQLQINMKQILFSVLMIAFIIVVLLNVLRLKNQLSTLFNAVIIVLFISVFGVVMTMLNEVKNVGITEAGNVVGVQSVSVSKKIYAENTVDTLKSLERGRVVTIEENEIAYLDTEVRLSKKTIDNVIVGLNNDGTPEVEELQDGVFGYGDVRYLRYKTDYWNVNITLFVTFIIYLLGVFKLGYLLWQWLSVNVFGTVSMAKGFWNLSAIGMVFKSALVTIVGIIITYMSMLMFSFLCSEIMKSTDLTNWVSKGAFLFAIGMGIIVGSGFVNDTLGIDDGSNFALKSIFMANRLGRLGKAPFKALHNGANKIGNSFPSGNKKAVNFSNGTNNGGSNGGNESSVSDGNDDTSGSQNTNATHTSAENNDNYKNGNSGNEDIKTNDRYKEWTNDEQTNKGFNKSASGGYSNISNSIIDEDVDLENGRGSYTNIKNSIIGRGNHVQDNDKIKPSEKYKRWEQEQKEEVHGNKNVIVDDDIARNGKFSNNENSVIGNGNHVYTKEGGSLSHYKNKKMNDEFRKTKFKYDDLEDLEALDYENKGSYLEDDEKPKKGRKVGKK